MAGWFTCRGWSLLRCLRISPAHAHRPWLVISWTSEICSVWNLRFLISAHDLKTIMFHWLYFQFLCFLFWGKVCEGVCGSCLESCTIHWKACWLIAAYSDFRSSFAGESNCPAGYAAGQKPLVISFQKGRSTVFTRGKVLSGHDLFVVKLLIMREKVPDIEWKAKHMTHIISLAVISAAQSYRAVTEKVNHLPPAIQRQRQVCLATNS